MNKFRKLLLPVLSFTLFASSSLVATIQYTLDWTDVFNDLLPADRTTTGTPGTGWTYTGDLTGDSVDDYTVTISFTDPGGANTMENSGSGVVLADHAFTSSSSHFLRMRQLITPDGGEFSTFSLDFFGDLTNILSIGFRIYDIDSDDGGDGSPDTSYIDEVNDFTGSTGSFTYDPFSGFAPTLANAVEEPVVGDYTGNSGGKEALANPDPDFDGASVGVTYDRLTGQFVDQVAFNYSTLSSGSPDTPVEFTDSQYTGAFIGGTQEIFVSDIVVTIVPEVSAASITSLFSVFLGSGYFLRRRRQA